ncbi:MAG: NAD(P)H-quinone oxidoreductase [Pseudomonadota bacterium]
MKQIKVRQYGGPEVLELTHAPKPIPAPGQILIKVAAAGVNRPDCLQRSGQYAPPQDASPILGLEVAGTVVEAFGPCHHHLIGRKVCALTHGGGYSEYVLAQPELCLPVPAAMTISQAACIPETFFTVWYNLFMQARLKRDETVLIHGGASGIGTTAIQLAKAFGAQVFVTVSNADKAAICRQLGADLIINHQQQDFVALVLEQTRGFGVDVVLDMVGGDYINRNLRCLGKKGRLAQIAFLRGARAEVNFLPMMTRRLTLTGSTMRPRSLACKAAIASELKALVWPLLESGKVAPVMDQCFPLELAEHAHQRMEAGLTIGKMALLVDDC